MTRRQFLRWGLGAAVGVPALGLGYGRLEASWVRVRRTAVALPRLPAPFHGTTVAVLADLHHGPFTSLAQVESVVATTNALRPDLVALVGDYVTQSPGHVYIRPCLGALGELQAPLGVFAVPGNHDHWDSIKTTRRALSEFGLADITNAGRWVERGGARLRVGGIDDFWEGKQDVGAALADATPSDACLLLCHNPDFAEEKLTDRRVGLVLSGHTHGGQIVIPGLGHPKLPSKYGEKYLGGLARAPHALVYVSRGIGTTGVPFRFRCRPEICLLTLTV